MITPKKSFQFNGLIINLSLWIEGRPLFHHHWDEISQILGSTECQTRWRADGSGYALPWFEGFSFFFCKNSKVSFSKTHDLITFTIPASALISIKLFKVSGIFIIELSVLDVVTWTISSKFQARLSAVRFTYLTKFNEMGDSVHPNTNRDYWVPNKNKEFPGLGCFKHVFHFSNLIFIPQ